MEKKFSMFSNGLVVANENGKMRQATKEETIQHFASFFPEEYKGEPIEQVKFNSENGYVYAKTANHQIKKKVINKPESVKTAKNQEEPVDGPQKVKETEVPRNESKAKPQESTKITKDRPDVGNPDEIRTKDYKRGKGGEDLHSNEVPRSESNGGLEGGNVAETAEEEANKATSKNPDKYVQEFHPSEKPAPAGSEMNHAAGREINFRSGSEIYHNLQLKQESESEDSKPGVTKSASNQSNVSPRKKLPWETDTQKESKEKVADKNESFKKEANTKIANLEKEIQRFKVREARRAKATEYALAMLKLNPAKYASADVFNNFVDNTVSKMTVEAIENSIEGLSEVIKAAEQNRVKKEAQDEFQVTDQDDFDGGLAQAIHIEAEPVSKTAGKNQADELKEIFLSQTHIGKLVSDHEKYEQSQYGE